MTTRSTHFDFDGSVVLVTGGGTGIGRAIVLAFAAAGATVVVTAAAANPSTRSPRPPTAPSCRSWPT